MISVCIPSFNGSKYIKLQLISILTQLSKNDEVVISDDSSTDDTIEIIKSINDNRVKLFENNKFRSPIYNLENALKHSKGDYIFLSDQDDVWINNKVEIMYNYLQTNDLVISDCILIDADSKIIAPSFYKLNNSKKGFLNNFIHNGYLGCCMAFNRQILNYNLPFPRKIAMHDIWIGLNTEIHGKVLFIDDKLVMYRRHSSNYSPTAEKSKFSLLYKIKYRLKFLILIGLRYMSTNFNKSR